MALMGRTLIRYESRFDIVSSFRKNLAEPLLPSTSRTIQTYGVITNDAEQHTLAVELLDSRDEISFLNQT